MTIQRAREILEKDGGKYTDEQVLEFMNTAKFYVDLLFDEWHKMTPEERKKYKKR